MGGANDGAEDEWKWTGSDSNESEESGEDGSVVAAIPFMQLGETLRNVFVGFGYVV